MGGAGEEALLVGAIDGDGDALGGPEGRELGGPRAVASDGGAVELLGCGQVAKVLLGAQVEGGGPALFTAGLPA